MNKLIEYLHALRLRIVAACLNLRHSLLTKLNLVATLLGGFAITHQNFVTDMAMYLPEPVRKFVPGLIFGWFALVQYAQWRDKQKPTLNG